MNTTQFSRNHTPKWLHRSLLVGGALLLLWVLGACGPATGPSSVSQALMQTQTALSVQMTSAAMGESGGLSAADLEATRIALAVQQTTAAQQAGQQQQPAVPTSTNTTQAPVAPSETETEPPPAVDFDTWVQSANILLYEDIAGDYSLPRYVKAALDGLGYSYVDVGDALGNFKDQILSGGPGGEGWDLIVSASESRSSVQGEFFTYINDAITQGSSVAIEVWALDQFGSGTFSNILSRCGLQFQRDWDNEPISAQVLSPIDSTNPILHEPNDGISLTNPTGYWASDIGDLLRLAPGSSSTLLWGARGTEKTSYGVAASCLGGRVIIQTYSSHSYGQDRVTLMWQNYIYNALKARFAETQ